MATGLEDLEILKQIENVADRIWDTVLRWNAFARDVIGKQLTRAVDSVGANVAESFGRFHYGEKINFLYYARGSLFETKYCLNRAVARNLLDKNEANKLGESLTIIARQLNNFVASLKRQKRTGKSTVKEQSPDYLLPSDILFTSFELDWLQVSKTTITDQSLISNLQSPQDIAHD